MYEDEDSDFLDFGGDSDEDGGVSESSEDELEILLNASPEQRRQLQQQRRQEKALVEDDFEREMNAELEERVTELEAQRKVIGQLSSETKPQASSSGQGEGTQDSGRADSTKFYDDMYFDSDDEDDGKKDKDKHSPSRKRAIPSNDDLLYDPNMDEEDEKWVTEQRQRCAGKTKQAQTDNKTNSKLARSDAVLDCPACMTTLCRDCQRHDVYDNQYRAMFVSNCVVDKSELLKFPVRKEKRRRKKNKQSEVEDSEDKYNPVKCSECNTVVAMYDKDELYHFFNVLASY